MCHILIPKTSTTGILLLILLKVCQHVQNVLSDISNIMNKWECKMHSICQGLLPIPNEVPKVWFMLWRVNSHQLPAPLTLWILYSFNPTGRRSREEEKLTLPHLFLFQSSQQTQLRKCSHWKKRSWKHHFIKSVSHLWTSNYIVPG